jgi:hypothetical protein
VDCQVAFQDLVLQFIHFKLIHFLDLVVSIQIGLLEVLELPLELLELPSYPFIFLRQPFIGLLELLIKVDVIFSQLSKPIVKILVFSLQFI